MEIKLELNEREIELLYHTMCDKLDEECDREEELKKILNLRIDTVLEKSTKEGIINSNKDQKSYIRLRNKLEKYLLKN